MKFKNKPPGLIMVIALSMLLAVCHKSTDENNSVNTGGNSDSATGAHTVSRGVMKKGSVIVNDIRFVVAGAQIMHGVSPSSEAGLQDGMVVKVRGSMNPDGVTGGVAVMVKTESELQGTITAKGVDSITLLGQQAFVDDRTVFGNVSGFQALAAGQGVEVYGMRDRSDRLLATRIEALASDSRLPVDRLKGVVEEPFSGGNPPALTFKLRGFTVITSQGTLIQPDGASVHPGDPVEVHGFLSGTAFTAGRIDRVDLEDEKFEPRENEEFGVEGFVSGFTGLGADFHVGETTARLTGATRFENGVAEDLVNNVRVYALGRTIGGVLIADMKIQFTDKIRIEANADEDGSAKAMGKAVTVTGFTELTNLAGGVAGIAAGRGLKISGFANQDGSVTATRLEGLSDPVAADKIILQGPVEAFDATAHTITVLGIDINAAGVTGVELDGQLISLDRCFAMLTVDDAVVKAVGSFNAGPPPTLTAAGLTAVGIENE